MELPCCKQSICTFCLHEHIDQQQSAYQPQQYLAPLLTAARRQAHVHILGVAVHPKATVRFLMAGKAPIRYRRIIMFVR